MRANEARWMEEWASLIRIPSVSCQPEHKADMLRCAERWRELLLAAGCQRAEVMPAPTPDGNPFVFAEYQCQNGQINAATACRSTEMVNEQIQSNIEDEEKVDYTIRLDLNEIQKNIDKSVK